MTDMAKYKTLTGLGVPHDYAVALAGGGPKAAAVLPDLSAITTRLNGIDTAILAIKARLDALEAP